VRPTPEETIAGIRRILRDVVEPEVTSEYARARLREVRAALAQTDWNDTALRVRAEAETQRAALAEINTWAAADPTRAAVAREVPSLPAGPAPYAELSARHTEIATALASAVEELARWCTEHPSDTDAHALRSRLITRLAQPSMQ
jgi:hypothetical protein